MPPPTRTSVSPEMRSKMMKRFWLHTLTPRLATRHLDIYNKEEKAVDHIEPGEVVEIQPEEATDDFFPVSVQSVQGFLRRDADCHPFGGKDLLELPLALTVTLLDDLHKNRDDAADSLARIFLMLFSDLPVLEKELALLASRVWQMMCWGPVGNGGAFGHFRDAAKIAQPFFEKVYSLVYADLEISYPGLAQSHEFINGREAVKASLAVLLRSEADERAELPLHFLPPDVVQKLATLDVLSLENSLQHIEEAHKTMQGTFQRTYLDEDGDEKANAGEAGGLFDKGKDGEAQEPERADIGQIKATLKRSEDGKYWVFTDSKEQEKKEKLSHPNELTLTYLPSGQGKDMSAMFDFNNIKDADSVVDTSSAGDSSEALAKEEKALLQRSPKLRIDGSPIFNETNNMGVDIFGTKSGVEPTFLKEIDHGSLGWLYDQVDWKSAVGDGGDFLIKNPKDRFSRIKYFKDADISVPIDPMKKPKKKLDPARLAKSKKNALDKGARDAAYLKQPGLQIKDFFAKEQAAFEAQSERTINVAGFLRRTNLANVFLESLHRYFLDPTRRALCLEQIAMLVQHPPHVDGSLPMTHPELVKQEIADDVLHILKSDGTMKKMIDSIQEGEYDYTDLYKSAENLYALVRKHPKCLADDIADALSYTTAACEAEITRVEKEHAEARERSLELGADAPKAISSDTESENPTEVGVGVEEILDRISLFHQDLTEIVVDLGIKGGREDVKSKADVGFAYIAESAVKVVQLMIDERQMGRHTRTSEREFLEAALGHFTLKLVVLCAYEHFDTIVHDEYDDPRASYHDQLLAATKKRGLELLDIFRKTFSDRDLDESLFDAIREKLFLEINDVTYVVANEQQNTALPQTVDKLSERSMLAWRFQADVDILVDAMLKQVSKRIWDGSAKRSNVLAEFEKVLSTLAHRSIVERPAFYVDAGVGFKPELESLARKLEIELLPQSCQMVSSVVLATLCVHHAQYLQRMQDSVKTSRRNLPCFESHPIFGLQGSSNSSLDVADRVTWTNRYEHSRMATLDTLVTTVAKLIRQRVEKMQTSEKNKNVIEEEILADCEGKPDLAYERAEHLLKFLVWKLHTDLITATEVGVLEQPSMQLVPNPEIVASEIVMQFAAMLEDRVRRLHIKDALLMNASWQNPFVTEIGVQLRIKCAALYGSIEQIEDDKKDGLGESKDGQEGPLSDKPTDSQLLTDMMGKAAKQAQTDISCTRGDDLPPEARYLTPGESGNMNDKAVGESGEVPAARVSILQSRDGHTVVTVTGDRTQLLEVVGMSNERQVDRVPGTEPHRTKRDLIMIIPDQSKVSKTRELLELFSSFVDVEDALDLMGPEKDNDGTVHEQMKIVLVHMDEAVEDGGIIDILACTGMLQDSEQLIVLEHEMDRDDRLLECLCHTIVDPELGEVMIVEHEWAGDGLAHEKRDNEDIFDVGAWYKPTRMSDYGENNRMRGLARNEEKRIASGGQNAESSEDFKLKPLESSRHYKAPLDSNDVQNHCKVMKPTTSNNVTNFKMSKAMREKEMVAKPDFRVAMEGIAEHCIAGVLGERFKHNERLSDLLTRAGAHAVIAAAEVAAQVQVNNKGNAVQDALTTASTGKLPGDLQSADPSSFDPNSILPLSTLGSTSPSSQPVSQSAALTSLNLQSRSGAKAAAKEQAAAKKQNTQEDASLTVLEEVGRFAARQALASGELNREKEGLTLYSVAEALLVHARVGAAKFLKGTTEHLQQLGVAELLEHETSVAAKGLLVALFGRAALQELGGAASISAAASSGDDPDLLVETLERAAMKAVVRRIYWRGEERIRQRMEYLTQKRHGMQETYRKNMASAWADKVATADSKIQKSLDARRGLHGVSVARHAKSGQRKLCRVGEYADVTSDVLIRNFRLGDHMDVLRPGFGTTTHGRLKCNSKDTQHLVLEVINIAKTMDHDKLHTVCPDFPSLAKQLTSRVSQAVMQFCPPDIVERNISLVAASKTLYGLAVVVTQPGPGATKESVPKVTVSVRQVADPPLRLLPIVETEIDALGAIHDMASGCAASVIGRGLGFVVFPVGEEAVKTAESLSGTVMRIVEAGKQVDGEVLEDFQDCLNASIVDEMNLLQACRCVQFFVEAQCDLIMSHQKRHVDLESLRKVEVGCKVSKDRQFDQILGGENSRYVKAKMASTNVLVAEACNALALEMHRSSEIELMTRSLAARWRYAPVKLVCNISDAIEQMAAGPESLTVADLSGMTSYPENDARRVLNSVIEDVIDRRCEAFQQNLTATLLKAPRDAALVGNFLEQLRTRLPELREKLLKEMIKPELQHKVPDALPNDVTVLANFVLRTLELSCGEVLKQENKTTQEKEKALIDTAEWLGLRVGQQIEAEFGQDTGMRRVVYELCGILTDAMVINARERNLAPVVAAFVAKVGSRCAQTKYLTPLESLSKDSDEELAARNTAEARRSFLNLVVRELKHVSSFDGDLMTDFCERLVEMMEKEADAEGPAYHSGESISDALLVRSHHLKKQATHASIGAAQNFLVDGVEVLENYTALVDDVIEEAGVEARVKQHFVDTVGRRIVENLAVREIKRVDLRDEVINRLSMRGGSKSLKPQHRTLAAAAKHFEQLKHFVIGHLERISQMDAYELIFVETQVLAKKIADKMDSLMDMGVANERILAFVDAMEKDLFVLLENALVENKKAVKNRRPANVINFQITESGAGQSPTRGSKEEKGASGSVLVGQKDNKMTRKQALENYDTLPSNRTRTPAKDATVSGEQQMLRTKRGNEAYDKYLDGGKNRQLFYPEPDGHEQVSSRPLFYPEEDARVSRWM
ncbi:unnamed protein product [Amoebophrya sp. A25]|nr:unnamed protein product [Amoebophrya sp. A25]|eukprot:GSA25T00008906001.1